MNIPDIVTTSAKHMTRQERRAGIQQMIHDLEVLARYEGHMSAAWALEVVEAVRDRYMLRPEGEINMNMEYEAGYKEGINDGYRMAIEDMSRDKKPYILQRLIEKNNIKTEKPKQQTPA